jgi:hypothetical protein
VLVLHVCLWRHGRGHGVGGLGWWVGVGVRRSAYSYAYFNKEIQRLDNASALLSAEDLTDLLFDCVRLGKTHRLQDLFDAGADVTASADFTNCVWPKVSM